MKSGTSPTRRVFARMDRGQGPIVAAAFLGALAYLCAVGLLTVAAWLIARASQQPPVLALGVAAVSVRAFAIGRSGFRYAERLVGHEGAFRGLGTLRVQIYQELERRGPARSRLLGRGDLLQRIVGDVDTMQDLPLRVVLPWAQAVIVGIVSVVVAWWLLPWAGVVLAVGLVLAATVVPALATWAASDADRALAPERGRLASAMLTILQSGVDLRAASAAERAGRCVNDIDDSLVDLQLRSARGTGAAAAALSLVQGVAVVASAVAAVAGVADGRLDGVLLAVVVLLPLAAFEASLALPIAALALRRVRASAERLMEILDQPDPARPEPAAADPLAARLHPRGWALCDVSVRWPDADSDALHELDLVLAPGERLAVVGPSGSGKSTLASALVKFLDIHGTYVIDGVDVTSEPGDVVRARMGLLSQEAHVFDTSLEENLRLVRPDATVEDLADVLRRVHLDDWVAGLPHGMAQPMGEAGAFMSGGQRQRIGLARMLLADFAYLVLDEPTENLDAATAEALMADVFVTTQEAGLLLITHRMRDAMRCDRVVVLQQGRVVAQGTPDDVLLTSDWFAEALALERDAERWRSVTESLPVGELIALPQGRPALF